MAPARPRAHLAAAPLVTALALTVVACSRGAPTPASPRTAPAPGPAATGDAGPWMWTAGVVPAWRTSATIRDVIALDAGRALAVTTRGLDVVDLAAGGVSTHVVVPGSAAVRRVVHAGGRVLAYGQLGRATAAWTIDPVTLAATPVPLPDPAVAATKGYLELAVSPDGARLLTCSEDRWPTVRDASTLAPLRVFGGVEGCSRPRFLDADRVLLDRAGAGTGARVLHLGTGAVEAAPAGLAVSVPGPGGRVATLYPTRVDLAAGDRQVATHAGRVTNPQWLADGSALIAASGARLSVFPATGHAARSIDLPARVTRLAPVPGGARVVLQLGPRRLAVVDTTSGGTTTAADANLTAVTHVAPLAGAVVSAADRARLWRDGGHVLAGPPATIEALDADPGLPALYATFDGVFALDLRSGQVTAIDDGTASGAVDRHGDRVAWDADEKVRRRVGRGRAETWFRRDLEYTVTDLDVATGRIGLTLDQGYYVARPDDQALLAFHAFDCQSALYLWLERGRERAVTYDGVTVHLHDTRTGKGLGGVELEEDNIEAVAFIPGRDELLLVGAALYLWDPVARTAATWPLPAEVDGLAATALGVDGRGRELAIGFDDGAVLWARLDAVQARATPVPPEAATHLRPAAPACAGKPLARTLAELGADGGDDDDGDDGDDGDGGDEDDLDDD